MTRYVQVDCKCIDVLAQVLFCIRDISSGDTKRIHPLSMAQTDIGQAHVSDTQLGYDELFVRSFKVTKSHPSAGWLTSVGIYPDAGAFVA